jgi:hypothetical protein
LCLVTVWFGAALLSACGSDDRDQEAPEARKPPSALPVGQTHTLRTSYSDLDGSNEVDGELAVTLLEVDLTAPRPSAQEAAFVETKAGHRWARVRLRIRNTGDDPTEQSTATYLLVDAQGQRYEAESFKVYKPIVSCCGAGYEGDQLQPRDAATGYVAFQVPRDATPIKLRMTSPAADDNTALEWNLR